MNKFIKNGYYSFQKSYKFTTFFDKNKKLIDAFKNDPRYVLSFHGTNANVLEEYAKEVKAENVECSGAFPIEQTKGFLENYSNLSIISKLFNMFLTVNVRGMGSFI